jgi:hypothetical protein
MVNGECCCTIFYFFIVTIDFLYYLTIYFIKKTVHSVPLGNDLRVRLAAEHDSTGS